VFDLKTKKETARSILVEQPVKKGANGDFPWWGPAFAYFNAKSEPRVIFAGTRKFAGIPEPRILADAQLHDVAAGKTLHKFKQGGSLVVSRDGKYLVRTVNGKSANDKGSAELWTLDLDK